MIKAVIFDMDGVLVETELAYMDIFEKVLNDNSIPFQQHEPYQLIGKSWKDSVPILDSIGKGIVNGEKLIDLCFHAIQENPIQYGKIKTRNMEELLSTLSSKGIKIGVASASDYEEIKKALHETNFIQYVDTFYSGTDCVNNKPAPDVYLKVMDLLGVTPSECAVLEDSTSGIQAAKSANAFTIARKDMRFNIDQSLADTYVCDVYDVLKVINRG